ncbi:MAG TPA: hypothetical protein DEA44_16915, partial [Firmicutes bacterium]|nr:hypothetical protein [Bacillota bacterium]
EPRIERAQVPKKTSDFKKVSQVIRSIHESPTLTSEQADTLRSNIADEVYSYQPLSDNKAKKSASEAISKKGLGGAYQQWKSLVDSGKMVTKNDIVLAETLLTEAAAMDDMDTVLDLVSDLVVEGNRAGQVVQAYSIIKKLTPEGKAVYIEKAVKKINDDLSQAYKNRKSGAPSVQVDAKLMQELLSAKGMDAMQAVEDKISENIAEQIPSTVADKLMAWRYMSMLGNPKTHIRNVVGNVTMDVLRRTKDTTAASLEKVFLKKEDRTKSILRASKDIRDFAKQDFEKNKDALMSGGKYDLNDVISRSKRIFKNTPLEKVRKFVNDTLEFEDGIFIRNAYQDSLSRYIKARGYTLKYLTSNTRQANVDMQKARQYATTEALKATFRDANHFANWLSNLEKRNIAGRILVGGLAPFKKTPLNIMKRGVEYSPIGVIDGMTRGLYQLKKGDITGAEFIDKVSAGLTGSAVLGLGYYLARLGILQAGGDDEERKAYYDIETGEQPYSLRIGDTTITLDWLTPANMPLFIGAELYNVAVTGEEQEVSLSRILDSLTKVSDPLLQLSMLQGINDAMSSFG